MRRAILPLILAAACARKVEESGKERGPAPPGSAPAAGSDPGALPFGFRVDGEPAVTAPFLPPDATWRFLVSQLTLLRADARREGRDLLVTFEEAAFHATGRDGARHSWRLPEGLRLAPSPVHLLLRSDLGLEIASGGRTQVVTGEEIAIVTARLPGEGGNVQEIRLVAKGGQGFPSISTSGQAG